MKPPYGFIPEPTFDIGYYFTPDQQKELIAKLKTIYIEEGQLMAEAKRDPIACVRRPNETAREFTRRCHAVPDHLNGQAWQWARHQDYRRFVKSAIKCILDGHLPVSYQYHDCPESAKELLRAAWDKHQALRRAAWDWLEEQPSIDTKALQQHSPLEGVTFAWHDMS